MSEPDESRELTVADRIARLRGIRSYVEDQDYGYLDITGLYDSDPIGQSPFVVSGTFIPEEIGGNVTVIDADSDADGTLAQENLNQMLGNFLPGGYKQRWGNFDLWRGAWHHDSTDGHVDVAPMFEGAESFPLTDLLGDVSSVAYTELDFDPSNVRVYIPRHVRVTKENKKNPEYVWIPEKGIVWTGDPPMTVEPLSSDPTTSYLWFKHAADELDYDAEPIDGGDIVTGFGFDDDREFIRCYYASLLTLYPKDSTEVKSGLVRYRWEEDDTTAFVASREQSQLLAFELNRDALQTKIESTLESNPKLDRDIRFALLRTNIWERLFFQEEALKHKFAIEPLVEHLLGIDYWRRTVDGDDLGVFGLSGTDVVSEIERLLPDDSGRHLRLLGHESREVSDVFETVENNPGTIAELLARCRNEELVLEFAERVLVHSAEHALSTWSNNLTGSGTSFQLWYDVNFQAAADDKARISVYDPVQGGAGIAKEVYGTLQADTSKHDIETGLGRQGCCHTGTADRATISLLASYPDGSLYDVFLEERDEFLRLVEREVSKHVEDPDAYSRQDLISHVDQRVRSLFETRELATFYSYVAREYTEVAADIERLPRVVDLALHLDRHVFRDPQIKSTYERFADDSGRRDIAELGERLAEITVQCVTACPDCLKTEAGRCLHSTGQQETRLNRRLLRAVFAE